MFARAGLRADDGGVPRRPPPVQVIDVAELAAAMSRDESLPRAAVMRRDRKIGEAWAALPDALSEESERTARVLDWLAKTRDTAMATRRHQWVSAVTVVGVAVVLLGGLVGWLSAKGVFWYDGQTPVNVIRAVLVYGVLNLVLLVVTGVLSLPWAIPGRGRYRRRCRRGWWGRRC